MSAGECSRGGLPETRERHVQRRVSALRQLGLSIDREMAPAHYAAASERIKYALATSALLSADLRDALQLYPPLHAAPPPPAIVTRTVRRAPLKATVEWPQGWEHAGSLVDNALHAWSALVNSLSPPLPQATARSLEEKPAPSKARSTRDRTAQEAATAAVNRFVAAAQLLDLEIAAALSAIKQLECIAHGLGLSVSSFFLSFWRLFSPIPPLARSWS